MNIQFTEKEKIDILEAAGLTVVQELETYMVDVHRFETKEESMHVLQVYAKAKRVVEPIGGPPHKFYYVDRVLEKIMKDRLLNLFKNKRSRTLSFWP